MCTRPQKNERQQKKETSNTIWYKRQEKKEVCQKIKNLSYFL